MKTISITILLFIHGLVAFSQPTRDLRINDIPSVTYFTQSGNTLDVHGQVSLYPADGFIPNSTMDITWPFRVGFYLSTDPVITTSDILIGTYTISYLQINTSHNCSVYGIDLSTISGLTPGTYYIGIYADDLNGVYEDNETNNSAAFKDWSNNLVQVTYGSVGIGENSFENNIEFLNTSDGITVLSKTGEKLAVSVYSLSGQLVFRKEDEQVSLSNSIGSGMLLLTIEGKTGVLKRKIIF
ncbi:MAG: hypothetical protein HJHJAOHD_02749 [Flavobacteriales bacterium]|nr:hypothetical protein [Flavobacteriales bacterium]